jgi:parallel beta-helix repeat protein
MKFTSNIYLMLPVIMLMIGCSGTAQELSLQEQLITAKPGDVIIIGEGTHYFDRQLSLIDVENVTIRGSGMDKTVLSFSGQIEGAEGLFVRANGVTIKGLTVKDTRGDGIKVQDSDTVTIRDVRVTWSGGPSAENGAYGLYPVGSNNILIENCEVSGASDAGIYVGQSEEIIVRNNRVFENVAGIEIENSIRADVYENEVINNTGGILVFDLPNLALNNGRDIRVYQNRVIENNHPNFAPPGNIVGMVPAGTGVLVMATENVDVFDNVISGHQSINTAVVSYHITELEYTDEKYNPFASGVFVFRNQFNQSEAMPDTTRAMGRLIAGIFGADVPDFIYDGIPDPTLIGEDGSMRPEKGICFADNGDAIPVNINAPSGFADLRIGQEHFQCHPELLDQRKQAAGLSAAD